MCVFVCNRVCARVCEQALVCLCISSRICDISVISTKLIASAHGGALEVEGSLQDQIFTHPGTDWHRGDTRVGCKQAGVKRGSANQRVQLLPPEHSEVKSARREREREREGQTGPGTYNDRLDRPGYTQG